MNKIILGIAILALIVAGIALVGGNKSTGVLGADGDTNYTNMVLSGYLKIGASPDAINGINEGTCYIRPYATTIGATSTVAVDCQATGAWNANGPSALTGVTMGDAVNLTLSTTTAQTSGFGGLTVMGASASTTSGYITIRVMNLTGTTYTWPVTGTASGTATYLVAR